MNLAIRLRKLRELLSFDNGVQVLLNRLFFQKTPFTIYRYRGVVALVDHSRGDQDGVKSCLIPGLYDPFLEIIAGSLHGPVTLLDFGANTGGFPLALLAQGFEIRRGISVELNPVTCTRLAFNLAHNGLWGRFIPVSGAVCGSTGRLTVTLSEGSVSDSILTGSGSEGESLTVSAWTVDDLVRQHFDVEEVIDVCKIDIEGAEYEVFAAPSYQSLGRCRWIVIEIHDVPGHRADEITGALDKLGFDAVLPARKAVEDNVFLFRRREVLA